MNERRWNWHLWAGFLFCLIGFASYPLVFAKFPIARDIPWANYVLFGTSAVLLLVGLKRAFQQSQQYRGKIAGSILGALSVLALVFFSFIVFHMTRQLPASAAAPRVGQQAPEFVLPDTSSNPVSLSSLLSVSLVTSHAPLKGVLLVFYRGYW